MSLPHTILAVDLSIAAAERRSLNPPVHRYEHDSSETVPWSKLNDKEQRTEICNYLHRFPHQRGLIGEAVNEHKLGVQIESAFFSNNQAQLATLVDTAIREYLGFIIENDPDWRIQP